MNLKRFIRSFVILTLVFVVQKANSTAVPNLVQETESNISSLSKQVHYVFPQVQEGCSYISNSKCSANIQLIAGSKKVKGIKKVRKHKKKRPSNQLDTINVVPLI